MTITLGAAPVGPFDGELLSAAAAPINAGLVFCVGSAASGSALLAQDQISGALPTLLPSGNLAATNSASLRCLESTSLTDGGAYWASSAQLRTITTQRTLAFHGRIDSFGAWASLISVPYLDGTWNRPWMSTSLRRNSTLTSVNAHYTHGGTAISYNSSTNVFSTGEHWFVVTLDGAAEEGKFYLDGALVNTVSIEGAPVDWSTNQPVSVFNKSNSVPGEGTIGRCYTAAIWNRILSAAEILSLYQSPRQMFAIGPNSEANARYAVPCQSARLFRSRGRRPYP